MATKHTGQCLKPAIWEENQPAFGLAVLRVLIFIDAKLAALRAEGSS